MEDTTEEERIAVEMLDPQDHAVLQGTARVRRDPISREMTGLGDYRTDEGRPVGLLPEHRWVMKLTTAETPVVVA